MRIIYTVVYTQGEVLQVVGIEPPQPGCQPSMLELKTSSMQIIRLPLDYDGNFEEALDYYRLYTIRMYIIWAKWCSKQRLIHSITRFYVLLDTDYTLFSPIGKSCRKGYMFYRP